MNDYDHHQHNNVKILVRIRNHPEEKDSLNDTLESQLRLDRTNKSFSQQSSVSDKSRSKSPSGSNTSKLSNNLEKTTPAAVKAPCLDEGKKYTMFTSHAPASSLVITEKPITGKLINNTFLNENDIYEYSYSILTDASILQFDRVYNETHKLESLYSEQVKDSINNLFIGKNSCLVMFGPKNSGKSFTLRGGAEGKANEIGILGRSIIDLFNLVEISKQANIGSKTKGAAYFTAKLSVYQVYMSEINDLLSPTGYTKNLKVEKYYDERNNLNTNILNLTQKEIKNKKDYDMLIKEAMNYRKLLSQYLKVNELKRKSHLVVSIILEKREKINEYLSKTTEKAIENFSQMDFVELASSEYGIHCNKEPQRDVSLEEKALYKDTSKTFNSICSNIVSASAGCQAKNDSKLTLALKSTLRSKSQICFLSCVQPYQVPLASSYKCLKFANWLRNQVHNMNTNADYQVKSQFEDSENDREKEDSFEQRREKERMNYRYGRDNRKDFLEDELPVHTEEIPEKYTNYPSYKKYLNYNYDEDEYRRENLRSQNQTRISNTGSNMDRRVYSSGEDEPRQNTNFNNNPYSPMRRDEEVELKEKKLREMEYSLRNLEAKSLEISRCIENMRVERSRCQEETQPVTINSPSNKFSFEYDNDRLKHENSTLKSDNIIFREDINRLTDLNRHLEEELSRQRNRNLELAADNERLTQERIIHKSEIEKLNENISRVKMQEHSILDQMNTRFLFENKMRELESDNRTLREEKQKFEVEFRVLSERHLELRKVHESTESELNFLKLKQTEEVNNIETKVEKMAKEIETLQKENNNLRVNEERIRSELIAMEKQRDNYRDKYQDYKAKNNLLNGKLAEIEDEFKKLVMEKQVESYEKRREEETKKMKTDTKQKILEDMQMRILNYKTELFRQRNKKEDF